MAVPTIALSSVCSTPHDFELSSRPSSTTSSSLQKSVIVGGLSCLFSSSSSSSSVKHGSSFSTGGEERGDDLGGSFSYLHCSSFGSSLKRDHSPVSVFQGPVSCSSTVVGSARSPPTRISRERSGDASFRVGSKVMFNGFVRNALSSCIDYDSPCFELHHGAVYDDCPSGIADELTFNMDDSFMEMNLEPYATKLLLDAQLRHKIFSEDFVVKAFYEAEKAHRGQVRASGDPYLQHCVETAVLLAVIGANSTVVAAGLLHDTLDDSFMSYDYILSTFGSEVGDLVEGVSKLSHLSKLARENDTASKRVEADRMHTMFLAMADARAVLVKLADRLHNMMTLDALSFPKQQRFAKETLEIFVPLANRLGIFSWKEQLENLCFKHLYPEQHEDMSTELIKSFDEAMIASAVGKLEQALKDENISYHVISGRHKSLYSIYCKMLKKKLTMDEIHDIHGLRLIVEKEEDCYKALKVVHQFWSELPGRFKDYITYPKLNGYQSLHTVVMGEGKVPLEVQIRTKEMHLQAEFGFAAHWRYKENDCKHSSFVLQMVEWARWVVTWQCETMSNDGCSVCYADSIKPPCSFPSHSDDCSYSYKSQCGHDVPVFVIMMENDKMSVQEFPANSTMMDLLGRASSKGNPYRFPVKVELRPRLNHEPVNDPNCILKMGDVVEITPAISDKYLTKYREEIQRMYDRGTSVPSKWPAYSSIGRRS